MPIDSTAALLFNINANADEATENIARFRALMGQDLDGMAEQFNDWSDEVIGKIDNVNAAMTAGVAAIAAGILAAGVAVGEATKEYQNYADEVGRGMRLTGLSAETLSAMHSAATKTSVSFEALTNGLVKFEAGIVKASEGSKPQLAAFEALGISQQDVIAGQKDLLPLLEKVMDGFHDNASAVQKAALARDLFSRSGPELLAWLSKGSEYLKENAAEAEKYGLILSTKDVMAAREFKLAQKELQEQSEALSVTVGKHVVPMLEKFEATVIAGIAATKSFAQGGLHAFQAPLVFLKEYAEEMAKIKKTVEAAGNQEEPAPLIAPAAAAAVKEVLQDFRGLSQVIDTMQTKVIAAGGTEWDKMANELAHFHDEADRAVAELQKLRAEGKVTPEVLAREMAALSRMPDLIGKIVAETAEKVDQADLKAWGAAVMRSLEAEDAETAALEKAGQQRIEVSREIADREAAAGEQGYAQQRASLIRQMDAWVEQLGKKTKLTAEDWEAIDKITMDGLAKIDRTETAAYQQDLRKLQEHLDSTTAANSTAKGKLYLDYQKELEQYSQVEEQKTLSTAQGEEQRARVTQMYAQIRSQITTTYQHDLLALANSHGWQAVFGKGFGSSLQRDSDLLRQWAISSNQSLLLVKVSLENLQQMAQKTFQQFVQGMGQSMASAIVTSKSVSQAMEQMLASTLESFAGQAFTAAIMATAWGFYDLAMGDYPAAAAAFTSAGIFGSVGAAAAIAGKYISPSQGGASASGSSASGGSAGGGAGGSGGYGSSGSGGGSSQQQPNVYVTVQGHVIGASGAQQLCDIINQAVYGNDATLYASHNPQGVPL